MKTDYPENQLQQLINTEINIRFCGCPIPIMINLIEEFGLGWDTAFYLPSIDLPPNEEHKGANFFIQYKLSDEIERKNGKHYKEWGKPYLRFFIPHKRGSNLDFHQYDRLKEIANAGYPVYYATNQIMSLDDLSMFARQRRLLEQTPFLKVNSISNYHKEVTFTRESTHFMLHSDIEKSNKVTWEHIFSNEYSEKTLRESIDFLHEILIREEKVYIKKCQ